MSDGTSGGIWFILWTVLCFATGAMFGYDRNADDACDKSCFFRGYDEGTSDMGECTCTATLTQIEPLDITAR